MQFDKLDLDQLKLQTGTDQDSTKLRRKPAQKWVKNMRCKKKKSNLIAHTVQKLRVISNKTPSTFDTSLSMYVHKERRIYLVINPWSLEFIKQGDIK